MKTVGHISSGAWVNVPLVLSPTCERQRPWVSVSQIEQALAGRALLLRRGDTGYELCSAQGWSLSLTHDGERLIVQDEYPSRYGSGYPSALLRDATARTMVARHARFDPDVAAFVAPLGVSDDHDDDYRISPQVEFVSPENWGFEDTGRAYQWTGKGLFGMDRLTSRPPGRSVVTRARFVDGFAEMHAGGGVRRGDPFHCGAQLKKIRALPELGQAWGELSGPLCGELALALGRCRLFGVELEGHADFTLTPMAAKLAAGHAIHLLDAHVSGAWHLPKAVRFVRAYHEREVVLERLEARMDVWAMFVAIDEAFEAAGDNESRTQLATLLRKVVRLVGRFDVHLQRNIGLLRLAAGTHLLANWRRLLAPWHREALPWWLDGSIE